MIVRIFRNYNSTSELFQSRLEMDALSVMLISYQSHQKCTFNSTVQLVNFGRLWNILTVTFNHHPRNAVHLTALGNFSAKWRTFHGEVIAYSIEANVTRSFCLLFQVWILRWFIMFNVSLTKHLTFNPPRSQLVQGLGFLVFTQTARVRFPDWELLLILNYLGANPRLLSIIWPRASTLRNHDSRDFVEL